MYSTHRCGIASISSACTRVNCRKLPKLGSLTHSLPCPSSQRVISVPKTVGNQPSMACFPTIRQFQIWKHPKNRLTIFKTCVILKDNTLYCLATESHCKYCPSYIVYSSFPMLTSCTSVPFLLFPCSGTHHQLYTCIKSNCLIGNIFTKNPQHVKISFAAQHCLTTCFLLCTYYRQHNNVNNSTPCQHIEAPSSSHPSLDEAAKINKNILFPGVSKLFTSIFPCVFSVTSCLHSMFPTSDNTLCQPPAHTLQYATAHI